MRGTQKAELQSLCGSVTNNGSVESATPIASRPASQLTPASAPEQPQSRSKKDHTSVWVETANHIHGTSDVGLLGELVELIARLLDEIKSAVWEYRDTDSVQVVLEVRDRFKLLKDETRKLDLDLGWAPHMKLLAEKLTMLALDLGQGEQLQSVGWSQSC